MRFLLIIILSVLCILLEISCAHETKLLFLTVIYRHGERTPIVPYPTDPWNDLKYWPIGWGQLTNTGKRQHYELGTWLRNRYRDTVLGDTYNASTVYIQSSDCDRTLMSAYANLAAMFPPTSTEQFLPTFPWHPIPVHTTPQHLDKLLVDPSDCDAFNHYIKDEPVVNFTNRLLADNQELVDYISKHSGVTITDLWGVQVVYDTLFVEKMHNKRLPEWTHKVFPGEGKFHGKMEQLSAHAFQTKTLTPQLARVSSYGRLLKEILQRFQNKTNDMVEPPERSVHIYSAHANTILGLLNIFGLFNVRQPPYASALILELRRCPVHKVDTVQILYRNSTDVEPEPLYIPNCGVSCPLSDIFRLFGHLLPKHNFDVECKWPPTEPNDDYLYSWPHKPSRHVSWNGFDRQQNH